MRARPRSRDRHGRLVVRSEQHDLRIRGARYQACNEIVEIALRHCDIGDDNERHETCGALEQRSFVTYHEDAFERRFEQSAHTLVEGVMAVSDEYATRRHNTED